MGSNKPSSFQARQLGKFVKIKGTKASPHNAQLLISTGVPSLDHVCGGGIPVGSVFLIEEDSYARYSKILLKYFLAEGAVSEHDLFVASAPVPPSQLIKELPGLVTNDSSTNHVTPTSSESGDKMKIAWRYQQLDSVKSSVETSSFGHYYDLSQTLDSDILKNTSIHEFDPLDGDQCALNRLYDTIKNTVDTHKFKPDPTDAGKENSVLRVGINSLGSPLWSTGMGDNYVKSLPLFLLRLKALMRASFAVSFVTVPYEMLQSLESEGYIDKLEAIADNVIHLESFMGSSKEKNPAFKDYHGLFHVRKLCRINSMCCHVPYSLDLAFKLRKKSFAIEILHLPPDLSETVSRSQASKSCTAAANQGLDF